MLSGAHAGLMPCGVPSPHVCFMHPSSPASLSLLPYTTRFLCSGWQGCRLSGLNEYVVFAAHVSTDCGDTPGTTVSTGHVLLALRCDGVLELCRAESLDAAQLVAAVAALGYRGLLLHIEDVEPVCREAGASARGRCQKGRGVQRGAEGSRGGGAR